MQALPGQLTVSPRPKMAAEKAAALAPLDELVQAGILDKNAHVTDEFKEFSIDFTITERCTHPLPTAKKREVVGSGVFRWLDKTFLEACVTELEKQSGHPLPQLRAALAPAPAQILIQFPFRTFFPCPCPCPCPCPNPYSDSGSLSLLPFPFPKFKCDYREKDTES